MPKISVVIHFSNSEQYLAKAIESVFRQTFTDWELILVDGGSADGSTELVRKYESSYPDKVRVLVHSGQGILGIFSSRIWGAKEARSPILAHLDSDDEWHPQFLERQYSIYQAVFAEKKGMVYCPMIYWWEDPVLAAKSYVQPIPQPGLHHPPELLLDFVKEGYQRSAGNSSVMISREIIIEADKLIGIADEKATEDQFLWSYVILKYPIFINSEPLVRYRQWFGSTCAATDRFKTIHMRIRHLEWLVSYLLGNYQGFLKRGLIKRIEREILEAKIKSGKIFNVSLASRFWQDLNEAAKEKLKNVFKILYTMIRPLTRLRIIVGVEPLSYVWGSDRGVPIHRYYIEQFLQEFSNDIKGHCLEFGEPLYIQRFGKGKVNHIDILHVDKDNPQATIVADLTKPNTIPSNKFDCIICTHVLHIISEIDIFVSEMHRILKPGGILLVAVPQTSMCDPDAHEFWRFTSEGLQIVLAKFFGEDYVTMRPYGNSLTAAGEIRGLVAYEFSLKELIANDPRFSVEICARVVKPS